VDRTLARVGSTEFEWALRARTHLVRKAMAHSVLIIEGELEFAEFIIVGLTEEGYSVRHATNGDQGSAFLSSQAWDVVLLDWALPGVRRLDAAPRLP
jgi:CheY-like chemotaxis protein